MSTSGWIRAEREARGLSQANLSRLLGISQPKLSQWETGKAQPSDGESARIRQILQTFDASLESGHLPTAIRPRSKRRIISVAQGDIPTGRESSNDAAENATHRAQRIAAFAKSRNSTSSHPKAVALFAGCGGMSLGFKWAGFDVCGFVESEPSARRIYQENFQSSVCLGHDVRDISDDEVMNWKRHLGQVDVLFGGPPCQGFSLTGKRDIYDPRNELYAHFARIASVLSPSVILFENVRLLTSMKAPDNTPLLNRIHAAFLGAGYSCKHAFMNAQDYGVPQFRERIFLLGVREGGAITFPAQTHGPREVGVLFPELKPYVTFRDACGDLESLESGERSSADHLHFAVTHPEHVLRWLRNVPEGESAHNNLDPQLRPPCGYNTTYKRIRWDEPCSTISTTFGMISGSRNVHPADTRSLTIREAARCQTFPDDFKFVGNLGAIRTAIGNAVPPLLARVMAEHIHTSLLKSLLRLRREATC